MPRPIDTVLAKFPNAKQSANGWYDVRCPAHDDRHASLGFTEADDGHVWFKCQAGCVQGQILKALGLDIRDIYVVPDSGGNGNGRPNQPHVVATYDYTDENGALIFQTVRFEPGFDPDKKKDFRQRQPRKPGMSRTNKQGKPRKFDPDWVWDLEDIHPVLFRLPAVLEALRARRTIYVAEGEKATLALVGLGLDATNSPLGAGKWRQHYAKALAGADVVLVPDNDEPGRKHMREAEESLRKEGCSVRVLVLPNLPPKGDAHDFVKAGGTREALDALVSAIEPADHADSEEDVADEDASGYHCSHIGNAERLVARYGDRFRYCSSLSNFLVYDGTRWRQDECFEVEAMAHQVVRSIPAEVNDVADANIRKAILAHAARSESNSAIHGMLDRCRPLPGVSVIARGFDIDPWLYNCANGTVDLRTGELRPHDPADHLMKISPVCYNPDAECPQWEVFLDTVMRGNSALITFLRRAVGYSLTAIARERCVFILHGGGRNGKSVFLNAVRHILGEYAIRTPTDTLLLRRERGIPNDVARLVGTRFVTASETRSGQQLDEALIKDLTGGEPISARFLNKEFFDFLPLFKLWLGTNYIPEVKGTDDAIWDRLRLIPFLQRFYIDGEDPGPDDLPADLELTARLYEEADGILAMAVRDCLEWQRYGLTYPAEVRRAVQKYRADMDSFTGWIEECCDLGRDYFENATVLYNCYKGYCEDLGISPETQNRFGARMKSDRRFASTAVKGRVRWLGLQPKGGAGHADPEINSGLLAQLEDYEPGQNG